MCIFSNFFLFKIIYDDFHILQDNFMIDSLHFSKNDEKYIHNSSIIIQYKTFHSNVHLFYTIDICIIKFLMFNLLSEFTLTSNYEITCNAILYVLK